MHQITSIEPKWLSEVAPTFFRVADQNKISKRKAAEKIEPLFDRFAADKDDWVSHHSSSRACAFCAHTKTKLISSVSAKSKNQYTTLKHSRAEMVVEVGNLWWRFYYSKKEVCWHATLFVCVSISIHCSYICRRDAVL